MTRRTLILLAAAAVALAGWFAWSGGGAGEREIRSRLSAFEREFNEGATDGLASVARATRLGRFFTEDAVVDLGRGSPPIHGRETLMGMAARLQPRTAAFVLSVDDVVIETLDGERAEISLTAVVRRRGGGSGEESLDAREFAAELTRASGDWQLRRLSAIDTLR